VDSGGDPAVIPDLTWEYFEAFHKKYYHPSNSRIYFYGDDPVPARLELIDEYLSEFEARPHAKSDSVIGWQKKRDSPWAIEQLYPAGEDGTALMTVNWLINDQILTPQEELALDVLDDLLLGTPVSPLYKKLRESGLGESVMAQGVSTTLQQATFSIGMKGITDKGKIGELEELIHSTIKDLAASGFDSSVVEASLNSLEFELREFNTGGFPRGLSYMLGSMNEWIYDRDPVEAMRFEKPLAELRARLAQGEPVFQDLISRLIINNGHRVTVTSLPDTTLEQQILEREKAELEAVRAKLSEAEIATLVDETQTLKRRQQAEDPPEKLASIPSLSTSDLDKQARSVAVAVGEEAGVTVLRHDLPTNGILYADFGLDMRVVPTDLLPLVPLFCRCLTEMGTSSRSDEELSKFIRTHTGGVGATVSTQSKYGAANVVPEPEVVSHVFVRGKATYAKSSELFDVVGDLLTSTNFDNKAKFKQMVLETKVRMEGAVAAAGNSFASGRIGARYNIEEFVSAKMQGMDTIKYMTELAAEIEQDWDAVRARLERLRDLMVDRRNLIVNLSAEEKGLQAAQAQLEDYIKAMPLRTEDIAVQDWKKEMAKFEGAGEGFIVPTQVNYVGKGAQIFAPGEKTSGAMSVVSRFLRTSYLWDKVRVVGGAYGCSNVFSPNTGLFKYTSYRDPNLMETLKVYDETPAFLEHTAKELSPATLSNAIIGMVGDLDRPQQPDQKGFASMERYLTGYTDEMRQERREQVLGTSAKDFKEFGERLGAVSKTGTVAVVGSSAALESPEVAGLGLDVTKLL
jgi:Zn-dependent M16 (insulinase) family peptidase